MRIRFKHEAHTTISKFESNSPHKKRYRGLLNFGRNLAYSPWNNTIEFNRFFKGQSGSLLFKGSCDSDSHSISFFGSMKAKRGAKYT